MVKEKRPTTTTSSTYLTRKYRQRHQKRHPRGSIIFAERKAERTLYFWKSVYGWIREVCIACNGSGYYDNDNSPACGGCDGLGYDLIRGPKQLALKK